MTYLFHLLQPREKLRITRSAISKLLNLPLNLIIRVECCISYRKLQQWQNAVVSQIQKCQSLSQLNSLWIAIELDWYRYQAQYRDNYLIFVPAIWSEKFASFSHSSNSPVLPKSLSTSTQSNSQKLIFSRVESVLVC